MKVMNIWKVLKIEKSKDKNRIKAAYHELLRVTNPEDFPEEFKDLRQAYEEALCYADEPEEAGAVGGEKDISPERMFMEQVRTIYNHLSDRLNIEKWKDLMAEDICYALDTKLDIRNRLLTFLMGNYRLPREVWQLLDATFQFRKSKAELCELFPEDFIEHAVIHGIDNDIAIDLKLFEGAQNARYDWFISCYFKAVRAIDAREMDDARALLKEMQESDIYHPYMDIVRIRIYLIGQFFQQAREIAEMLYDQYPADPEVRLYMGETAFYIEEIDIARSYYHQVLEKEPENFLALYGLASCLVKEDKFEEAKEAFLKVLNIYPNNTTVNSDFEYTNKNLAEQYEEEWAKDKSNAETAYNLAWCYIQGNQIKEGLAILPEVTPVQHRYSG